MSNKVNKSQSKEVNIRSGIKEEIGRIDLMNDNLKIFHISHILIDAGTIIIAFLLAYYIRFYSPFFVDNHGNFYSISGYSILLLYLVPMYLLIYYIFRLYTPKRVQTKWFEMLHLFFANIFGIAFFTATLYFQMNLNISRKFLILFVIINVILSICFRRLLPYCLKSLHKKA